MQRLARRDKKAFLNDQCKEIEGNNRMGKTRDLFKKIRNTVSPIFLAKMGLFKISRELQFRLCIHGEWKCTHVQVLQSKRRRLFLWRGKGG